MENVKQVIVVRKDLRNSKGEKPRSGKLMAQVAHASMGALLEFFSKEVKDGDTHMEIKFSDGCILDSWLNGKFTKVCVSVDSEEELLDIYEKAKAKFTIGGVVLITDAGLTEFGGVATNTCVGIGPFYAKDIDEITGHLKLL
jgi:PTH2 family peptidyl-tRNA hydrolase